VLSGEEEIPTPDKILLLVSRILNDKSSVPGHVYRYLVKVFKERCQTITDDPDNLLDDETKDNGNVNPNEGKFLLVSRARRQDAHALIKHLTATLIDVRPGFASSSNTTELTAAAVEALVFGELFDLVFEEILHEVKAVDDSLTKKVEMTMMEIDTESVNGISQAALQKLNLLPQAHSPVDKLRLCVEFLECISEHFTVASSSHQDAICADSLLRMSCQHLVVAKIPNLNAEIAFLEEFARDEQLLRGKEGYALVTLQASTHFLNLSDNLYNDIFAESGEQLHATYPE
jgi:hypothetical protein